MKSSPKSDGFRNTGQRMQYSDIDRSPDRVRIPNICSDSQRRSRSRTPEIRRRHRDYSRDDRRSGARIPSDIRVRGRSRSPPPYIGDSTIIAGKNWTSARGTRRYRSNSRDRNDRARGVNYWCAMSNEHDEDHKRDLENDRQGRSFDKRKGSHHGAAQSKCPVLSKPSNSRLNYSQTSP